MSRVYKPYRSDYDYSYSLGVFPTLELLASRRDAVLRVLVSSDGLRNQGVQKVQSLCAEAGIPVDVNDRAVDRLSPKENCYAVGVFGKYDMALQEGCSHTVLVNPSDMGNLGTILRTIVGFGVSNLGIVRPGVDVFHPKVIRASMGAVFRAEVEYFEDFEQYRCRFSNQIFTLMLSGSVRLHEIHLEPGRPFTTVFGNEGAGLSNEYLDYGTSVVIPHSRSIDSLNLSVSVGIVHYELTKGRFDR